MVPNSTKMLAVSLSGASPVALVATTLNVSKALTPFGIVTVKALVAVGWVIVSIKTSNPPVPYPLSVLYSL